MKRLLQLMLVACALATYGCSSLGGGAHLRPATAHSESVREYLVRGRTETGGYGLYSYLLLGEPLTERNRDRYRRTVEAYLRIPSVMVYERDGASRWKLNLTLLPLVVDPPDWLVALNPSGPATELARACAWIIENYDYSRAQVLLARFGTHQAGPYFVSSLEPLSRDQLQHEQFLWQDMSSAAPQLSDVWVKHFMQQAAKPQFWSADGLTHWMLELRNLIAVASEVPGVELQLTNLIKLVAVVR